VVWDKIIAFFAVLKISVLTVLKISVLMMQETKSGVNRWGGCRDGITDDLMTRPVLCHLFGSGGLFYRASPYSNVNSFL
jgi:hypothetical protein